MLVDLRNDSARICTLLRHAADLTKVDRYSYVMQSGFLAGRTASMIRRAARLSRLHGTWVTLSARRVRAMC